MESFFRLVLLVAIAFAAFSALVFFIQEKLLFFPETLPPDHRFEFRGAFEERSLVVDGKLVHALYFPAPSSKGVVLYFHGNAGSLDNWGEIADELSRRSSYGVLILDYPGYGKSQGRISSEAQLHAIAQAFFNEALKLAGSVDKIVLYGRSIGSGLAAKLAAENEVAGVVLETPYFSLASLARELAPWVPTVRLLKYQLRSDLWVPRIESPILIVHGLEDEIIPVSHGQRLHALSSRAQLALIEKGSHNDLSMHESYWRAVTEFLSGL